MPDRIESYKLLCTGGLFSSENHLQLSDDMPGSATQLINYEPSLYGGYRRVEGFEYYDKTFPEVGAGASEGKVLCIAYYRNEHIGEPYAISARKDLDADTYSFWYHTNYIGWRKMAHPARKYSERTWTVDKVRFVQFDFGNGSQIVFVDGVNNALMFDGEDWFNLSPTGAGTIEDPGGDQVLARPATVDAFENHLFLSNDVEYQSIVAHSAPLNVTDFTDASGAGQIVSGFKVVQIKPFRDDLYVFGANSIKKLNPDIEAGFLLDQVTANVGCISTDSVVEIGGDLMFLSPSGLRPVAGTSRIGDVELQTISEPIKSLLMEAVSGTQLPSFNGVVIRAKSQVRYFLDSGDDSISVQNSPGLIGAIAEDKSGFKWQFGRLRGIRATCVTSEYIGAEEFVLHGDYDGCVYRQERGISFNNEDIIALYCTPYLDFGDTEIRKTIFNVNTFIRAEGPFEMYLGLDYNWGGNDTATPANYPQFSLGAPVDYGGSNVDYGAPNIIYGGGQEPLIRTSVEGSGFSVRATYVTVGQTSPYSIQGIVFEHSTEGRK